MNKYLFGIDLGGTNIKFGLFATAGELKCKTSIRTRLGNNGDYILDDIAKEVARILDDMGVDKSEVKGLGIGVPGSVMPDGTINKCVNLGWGVVKINDKLEKLTGLKVKVANDANCAALGEQWKGAGFGADMLLMVTLGTGVGGGIIYKGKIIHGKTGGAGEMGHICVNRRETHRCSCGKCGCLEQYASGRGIVELAKKYLKKHTGVTVLDSENLDAKIICDAARNGDEAADAILGEYADYLAHGIGTMATILNPEVVVIGGGVSRAGNILLDKVRERFKKYVFHASEGAEIRISELGSDAGIYGAAKLVI